MYELCPYFTNDGTVGLFSRSDDDIYHSTYGALTESWQKFILPAHFREYLDAHESVKVLDICYGIGYNTKTALNVFIQNAEANQKNKDTKKNYQNIFQKKSKINDNNTNNIEAIDADNIYAATLKENCIKNQKNVGLDSITNEAIDSDNIQSKFKNDIASNNVQNNISNERKICNKLLIDAVDLDNVLINLSPFITSGRKNSLSVRKYVSNKYFPDDTSRSKLLQINKIIKTNIKPLKKKYKLRNEVSIIILLNLLKQNGELLKDKLLQLILSKDKNSPIFSKYMINLAKFYSNQGCNYNKKQNKSTFLHNIYYRYISKSYKNAKILLENSEIELNFHHEDARCFIKKTLNKYNFIFLDAFTPAKCPSLWTVQFFEELYSSLEDDGMILTYSNSAAVRNAFLQNGFYVGKTYDSELNKFVGTVAVKDIKLIEYPLDERDLDLINSKAGICFKDNDLNLDNETIIKNREEEIMHSDLISSSKVLKGYKDGNVKSL